MDTLTSVLKQDTLAFLGTIKLPDTISILSSTAGDTTIFSIPVITALTALFAVLIGPAIQILIHKSQIKSQREIKEYEVKTAFIAERRMIWIDKMRDLFSEYANNIAALGLHFKTSEKLEKGQLNQLQLSTAKLRTLIQLSLNPLEKTHNDLIECMADAHERCRKLEDNASYGELISDFRKKAALILKEEWEKTKKMK